MTSRSPVASGLEIFLSGEAREKRGARIGLLAHAASVDRTLTSAVKRIAALPDLRLVALFGPEHGLVSGAQDMVAVGAERDGSTGLAVHSLYGDTVESLAPTEASLQGIDLLVADLQDVGARYYTFAATVALALGVVARLGKTLLLLDRPNPIGGLAFEGPDLAPAMRSFVGHIRAAARHGLTIGELVLHHAREEGLAGALEVVPMRGWTRSMEFEQTGLPWVPPSPNMPTLDTAWVYPGACLVEATNLSEGRGTTRPFEWIGAPYLDPDTFAGALAAEGLPGVHFRPLTFVPAFHKWAGQLCGGAALHVTDRSRFQPVRTGVALLAAAKRLAPSRFAWRTEPYEFVSDRPAIDLLTGGTSVREGIDAMSPVREIVASWPADEDNWGARRADSLLYPET